MHRYSGMTMGLPGFCGAVKGLVLVNAAVFLVQSLLIPLAPRALGLLQTWLALTPAHVAGDLWVWQLFTYQFLHGGVMHLLFNMLGLWMFGSSLQEQWGPRRFLSYFFLCAAGGGTIVTACAMAGWFRLSPAIVVLGASGGIFGVLLAFGYYFRDAQVFLFPFPVPIKARYLVGGIMAIAVLSVLRLEDSGAAITHLGGALTGYLYIRLVPRRGLRFGLSESYYSVRNSYHRWKRKQAQKKFEVYMRKQDARPPRKDNGEGGPGGWVN
jgi:membrane associated rhomboid family serine protease